MTRVAITKSKLDDLALHISAKSGEQMPLTIDEMQDAVDGIQTASAPNLQTKNISITPTTSAQSETIEADSGYDGLEQVGISVSAVPTMTLPTSTSTSAVGVSKATIERSTSTRYINIPTGYNSSNAFYTISATPNMTLPTSASNTSSGTRKAYIGTSETQRYINIPTGYNSTAAYYQLLPVGAYYVGSAVPRYAGEVMQVQLLFAGNMPAAESWTIEGTTAECYITSGVAAVEVSDDPRYLTMFNNVELLSTDAIHLQSNDLVYGYPIIENSIITSIYFELATFALNDIAGKPLKVEVFTE